MLLLPSLCSCGLGAGGGTPWDVNSDRSRGNIKLETQTTEGQLKPQTANITGHIVTGWSHTVPLQTVTYLVRLLFFSITQLYHSSRNTDIRDFFPVRLFHEKEALHAWLTGIYGDGVGVHPLTMIQALTKLHTWKQFSQTCFLSLSLSVPSMLLCFHYVICVFYHFMNYSDPWKGAFTVRWLCFQLRIICNRSYMDVMCCDFKAYFLLLFWKSFLATAWTCISLQLLLLSLNHCLFHSSPSVAISPFFLGFCFFSSLPSPDYFCSERFLLCVS